MTHTHTRKRVKYTREQIERFNKRQLVIKFDEYETINTTRNGCVNRYDDCPVPRG